MASSLKTLQLYNALTRRVEPLTPLEEGLVRVYTCGPTVYGTPSLGNFRACLMTDTLVRTLEALGYRVQSVMNITDVGHLVGDGNDGEDKLEVGAKREGKTAWDIAKMYTEEFVRDMERLNMRMPDVMPKATDHIAEQIAMVQTLEEKGFAYSTSDGMYFDTSKVADYGALAGQKVEEKEEGARVEVNTEKRNAADFALWKLSPVGAKRHMEWESPWGVGFPGWHIECTAMSTKYLGNLYDVHTGGMDLKMVHHPNEIAQAQGALGTSEARVWMHAEFLQVDGGKMSKSLGNAYTVSDVLEHGYAPLAYRYFVLSALYGSHLNFTWEALQGAQNAWKKLRAVARALPKEETSAARAAFVERASEALCDGLNTPKLLAILWEEVGSVEATDAEKAGALAWTDAVLGLGLANVLGEPLENQAPPEVLALLQERAAARAAKNFAESDRLRDAIAALGYGVEDSASGQRLVEKADI